MKIQTIRTEDLTRDQIPDFDADWDQISLFALSFDPKDELGDVKIYTFGNMEYDDSSTVQELRMCLFLKQRWWNNRSSKIDKAGLDDFRMILKLIRNKLRR